MKRDTPKSTILVISMGFLILFLIFKWQWAVIVSLIIGLIGILSDNLSRKIDWAWMELAGVLNYIIPTVLLSIVFYLILFPISLVFKLFNKDALMLSSKYDSYFITVNKPMNKKHMENTW